jgi:hypothetical protein
VTYIIYESLLRNNSSFLAIHIQSTTTGYHNLINIIKPSRISQRPQLTKSARPCLFRYHPHPRLPTSKSSRARPTLPDHNHIAQQRCPLTHGIAANATSTTRIETFVQASGAHIKNAITVSIKIRCWARWVPTG